MRQSLATRRNEFFAHFILSRDAMKAARRSSLFAILLLTNFSAQALAAAPPRAVVADPVRDAKHPAANRQLLIPSGGVGMNAVLLQASGAGPKPTLVLLHGLPGNEQNLDLAQAIRRAGWNVLTMHYRGSWGSPGRFSIAGSVEDAAAAMAFLRQTDNAAKYGIDPRRLFIGGHSMGGFAAACYAVAQPAMLMIGAAHGNGEQNKQLADAIRAQHGGKLTSMTIDSDHSFADHRIALSAAVVDWLQRAVAIKKSEQGQ